MMSLPTTPLSSALPDRFNLGAWQVNASLDEIAGLGQVNKLEPRAMRLLVVLAQAGGDVVLTDDLLSAVWPGLIVTPSSLYDAIAQLRKVLGAEHIATVARKGYRLVAAVTMQAPAAPRQTVNTTALDASEPRLGSRSVAVLPFSARSLPDNLSFLSESLIGALISELSRQPGLVVVALGTMLTFGQRHSPPKEVAGELGVRYVVDGQLELRGDTLHVGVQVVDGQRGTQTWADELSLPANAWHETASVVVGRLARALQFELNDLASRDPVTASDNEVQARAFAAQAWVQLFARTQTPETNQRATRLASTAVALAPELSQGWMCLAYADWRAGMYGWSDELRDAQLARSMAEAERAVMLDPRDPDAHYVLAITARHYHGQRQRSSEALRHCLRLSSSYAPAYGQLAYSFERNGQYDEALAYCDKAFELSPLEPLRVIWHFVRAQISLATGAPQNALDEAQRGMAINPNVGQLLMVGAIAAWRIGAKEQAHEWISMLLKHPAYCNLAAVRVTMTNTYDPTCLGQLERLLDTLQEAGLPQ